MRSIQLPVYSRNVSPNLVRMQRWAGTELPWRLLRCIRYTGQIDARLLWMFLPWVFLMWSMCYDYDGRHSWVIVKNCSILWVTSGYKYTPYRLLLSRLMHLYVWCREAASTMITASRLAEHCWVMVHRQDGEMSRVALEGRVVITSWV